MTWTTDPKEPQDGWENVDRSVKEFWPNTPPWSWQRNSLEDRYREGQSTIQFWGNGQIETESEFPEGIRVQLKVRLKGKGKVMIGFGERDGNPHPGCCNSLTLSGAWETHAVDCTSGKRTIAFIRSLGNEVTEVDWVSLFKEDGVEWPNRGEKVNLCVR